MDRWKQIETLFHAALERPAEERDAFLASACAGDAAMFREVASLLASHEPSDLADPWAAAAAARLLDPLPKLEPGRSLGPYKIVSFVAQGGMGAVYRAHDPRTARDVAIKLCAREFSERFAREVRVAASLNHANIATLHDVGPGYLVMELVEGVGLGERIQSGPMPVEEALGVARQIVDALDYAHAKGVVHRDLKPANIRIRRDGVVKVLDFGLAKIAADDAAPPDLADASDPNGPPTKSGLILGSAGHMSPEQARGQPVDKRTDIWAFGVVLYEMLTGRRLFEGDTASDTLAAVLKDEPQLERVPWQARRLVKSCLAKDPRQRLRDIGDAWRLLDEAPAAPARAAWRVWPAAALLVLALAGLGAGYLFRRPAAVPLEPVRFQYYAPDQKLLNSAALSPDGRSIAVVTSDGTSSYLWVHFVDQTSSRLVADIGSGGGGPFWSPDGRYIAIGSGGKLKKFEGSTGLAEDICDLPGPYAGGTWSTSGTIVLGTGRGIYEVAPGGEPVALTSPGPQEIMHAFPSFLPGGSHFLYTRISSVPGQSAVYVGSIGDPSFTQAAKPLLKNGSVAVFSPERTNGAASGKGYLVFVDTYVMARPFDARTLAFTGEATRVSEAVGRSFIATSDTGVLLYLGGPGPSRLTWFDRDGRNLGAAGELGSYSEVAISPDGNLVAMDSGEFGQSGVWVFDLTRRVNTRVTNDGAGRAPAWSPDGREVVFSDPLGNLHIKEFGGPAPERMLYASSEAKTANDWSRDGRYLLFTSTSPKTLNDVWVLPMAGDRTAAPFIQSPGQDGVASFSPDGRFVLYLSNESGQNQVYVASFPDGKNRWQISSNGGVDPRWRRDGKEILYMSGLTLTAVDVTTSPAFQAGAPRKLFDTAFVQAGDWARNSGYDLTPDGRILAAIPLNQNPSSPLTVVLNWQSALAK